MNYKELLEIISKPWIDTNGIMEIAQCGKNSAIKIRWDIEKSILDSGLKLPKSNKRHVPTKLVLEYLGLDVEYIKNMASIA